MQHDGNTSEDSPLPWEEIENRIARNRLYSYELQHASNALRAQSRTWLAAAAFLIYITTIIAFFAFASFNFITFQFLRNDTQIGQNYIEQTVLVTLLVPAVFASILCFFRFRVLRSLADEASGVSGFNDQVLMQLDHFDRHFEKGDHNETFKNY